MAEKSNLSRFLLILLINLGLMSSCSIFDKRGAIVDSPVPTQRHNLSKSVPKEQYDQLAMKYSELLKKSNESSMKKTDQEASELKKSLEAIGQEVELAETVDVFAKKNRPMNAQTKQYLDTRGDNEMSAPQVDYDSLSDKISQLRSAEKLLNQKKYDQALAILKELDLADHRQIRVRAKFLIGELLFMQSEYDLALQIFEEIISQQAFSGVVLKTLGRMIVCTEKLGQTGKKEKYFSILHDFFESA